MVFSWTGTFKGIHIKVEQHNNEHKSRLWPTLIRVRNFFPFEIEIERTFTWYDVIPASFSYSSHA